MSQPLRLDDEMTAFMIPPQPAPLRRVMSFSASPSVRPTFGSPSRLSQPMSSSPVMLVAPGVPATPSHLHVSLHEDVLLPATPSQAPSMRSMPPTPAPPLPLTQSILTCTEDDEHTDPPVLDVESVVWDGMPGTIDTTNRRMFKFEATVRHQYTFPYEKKRGAAVVVCDGTRLLKIVSFSQDASEELSHAQVGFTYKFVVRIQKFGDASPAYSYPLCRQEIVIERVTEMSLSRTFIPSPVFRLFDVCQNSGTPYTDMPFCVYFDVWLMKVYTSHSQTFVCLKDGVAQCDYGVTEEELVYLRSESKFDCLEKTRWRIVARPVLANKTDLTKKSVWLRNTDVFKWTFIISCSSKRPRENEVEREKEAST